MEVDLLARRIRRGDSQAFELFFRKYYLRLCSFSNKFIHDPEQSHDIVSDAFLKIWENRKNIDPENSLVSLAFKITQNLSLNHLRNKKVQSKYIDILQFTYCENCDTSNYDFFLVNELESKIESAIIKIPPQCRKIFELSRFEGLKYSQIAERMNLSIKTVEVQISKALKILRKELSDYL